jgi:geranylgeranyl reductase family protein
MTGESSLCPVSSPLPESCDALVVGAGPAGCAAAIALADAGREVVLADKAQFPRDKCCGDGLTTGALRLLDDLGFDPRRVPSWTVCDQAWLRSPSGREVRLDLPGDDGQFAAIAPRQELDAALVDLARSRGVRVLLGASFDGFVGDVTGDAPARASFAGLGTVAARHVVAADGMWSPVRKAVGAGMPSYFGEWHAFRQYATGVTGSARDRLWVWFEPDLLPGYAWSFPLGNGRTNIGFGILRGTGTPVGEMKHLWSDLLSRPHVADALGVGATMTDRPTAWPIPARITSAALARGRVLFVGDAACATDSLTGEGIGQALLTGRLAAEAIVAHRGNGARAVARQYRQSVKHELFADHRMSMVLGKILSTRTGARGAIRVASLTPWTRRNFVRWMFEDEPRAIALTPRRWHRGFLARPGAFRSLR